MGMEINHIRDISLDPVVVLLLIISTLPTSEQEWKDGQVPLKFFAEFCAFGVGNTSSVSEIVKRESNPHD